MEGSDARFADLRNQMVENQLASRGIRNAAVLEAMRRIPRHLFLDPGQWEAAYEDSPVPIGYGQTLSQPYIVAFMTEQLELSGTEKILEIGTGSGYQTAVLAELAREVYTLEIIEALAGRARALLENLGYSNVHFAIGDGRAGWPEESPFDAILAAAAADDFPRPLLDQTADGGRLILPLGLEHQELWIFRRTGKEWISRRLLPVRFVPLVHGGQRTLEE
jgi:protein-L-isoaspartate(D-aspartate) O-methyltransferase